MNNTIRNILIWLGLALSIFLFFSMFADTQQHNSAPINFSQFMQEIEQGHIKEANIAGHTVYGQLNSGQNFITHTPTDVTIVPKLLEKGVNIKVVPPDENISIWYVLLHSWPMILFGIMIFYSFRQMQSGSNRAMGFGRSKAKLMDDKSKRITFDDVAGIDEAKTELEEVVEFLKDSQKFQRLGGKIPKGVLLVGPPGTGKTLLARAIAGEAGVPFFSISGSDFVEMFVGVGASRVRDMFEQAKKNAPCIVFIDEIDAVGRHRGAGTGGGNDEREQTLNQLLVEMDGFEENQGIILVAATNRPDILDRALLRPGRFDREVTVPNPDVNGREAILKIHSRKVPLSPNVELRAIARGTPGFSGAELANLINEAALLAARQDKLAISMQDLELAKDKVMMGAERRSMAMTEEDKKITAFHEAGHAIIGHFSPDSDPIHKATIIPRGRALGFVLRLPEEDRVSSTRKKLISDIMVATGGRLAEEIIFGAASITTGAQSDIRMASDVARRMVTEWGMSDKLGFQSYNTQKDYFGNTTMLSPSTIQTVDEEISRIIDKCMKDARKILDDHKDALYRLAEALLERETLNGEEVKIVIDQTGELPPLGDIKSSVYIAHIETLPNIKPKASAKTTTEKPKKKKIPPKKKEIIE